MKTPVVSLEAESRTLISQKDCCLSINAYDLLTLLPALDTAYTLRVLLMDTIVTTARYFDLHFFCLDVINKTQPLLQTPLSRELVIG